MAFDLAQSNVDPDATAFQRMLRDLQTNILRGHGRSFARFLFLHLHDSSLNAAKKWIAHFAAERITNVPELERGRQSFKATGADGGAVFTLSISATGCAALGFKPDKLPVEMEPPSQSCRARRSCLRRRCETQRRKTGRWRRKPGLGNAVPRQELDDFLSRALSTLSGYKVAKQA